MPETDASLILLLDHHRLIVGRDDEECLTQKRMVYRKTILHGEPMFDHKNVHIFVLDTLANVTLSEDLGYIETGNDDGNFKAGDRIWLVFSLV
jgi:hypothetical protein